VDWDTLKLSVKFVNLKPFHTTSSSSSTYFMKIVGSFKASENVKNPKHKGFLIDR
jgi:hypothetical protein